MGPKIERIIRDMKSLKIQGASDTALAGLEIVKILSETTKAKSMGEFASEVEKIRDEVLKVRPTEPALRNVIKDVLIRIQGCKNMKSLKSCIANLSDEYSRNIEESIVRISEIGSQEIESGKKYLTHCHSRCVVGIFREAKKQDKDFEVFVTETRPVNQGIRTAKDLLKSGIKVNFIVDSAVGYVMKGVSKVFVGCDAILADGSIVNKVGTLPIAMVAKNFGVPVFVTGETYKFDSQTILGRPEPIEQRNPREIINPKEIKGANIMNPAFDLTPMEFIHTIITERGPTKPEWVRELVGI